MSRFNDFVEAVLGGVPDLARSTVGDLPTRAREDAIDFLEKTAADLQQWTEELARGDLTQQDFQDLVEAKKALAEIHALTQTGVALANLERFRRGLIDLVVNTAFDVFLP